MVSLEDFFSLFLHTAQEGRFATAELSMSDPFWLSAKEEYAKTEKSIATKIFISEYAESCAEL